MFKQTTDFLRYTDKFDILLFNNGRCNMQKKLLSMQVVTLQNICSSLNDAFDVQSDILYNLFCF